MEEKVVHKLFLVWNFEKEEQWLNTMAQEGWVLNRVSLCCYHFIPCQPGEYVIRLENHPHDQAYMDLMEETGAEYIGRMVQWVYFRKNACDGCFDLFSDIDSRIAHLDNIGKTLLLIAICNLVIGFSCGWVNFLCASLLCYAVGRIHGKKEALEKERLLHE